MFMMKKIYKICHCGHIFKTKLHMYEQSFPAGLQDTVNIFPFDLELRICPSCKTTFSIPIKKLVL